MLLMHLQEQLNIKEELKLHMLQPQLISSESKHINKFLKNKLNSLQPEEMIELQISIRKSKILIHHYHLLMVLNKLSMYIYII